MDLCFVSIGGNEIDIVNLWILIAINIINCRC